MSEHDERDGRPGFFSGAVIGSAITFFIMWRRKGALRAQNRETVRRLSRREVRVEGSTCFLGGVQTECDEIVSRIKPGQTVHLDATLGSQSVVEDLISQLQDADIEVFVTSE